MWFGIISRNWSSWHFQRKTQTWHLSLTYGVQGCFCLIVFIFLVFTHSGKECSSPKVCAPPLSGQFSKLIFGEGNGTPLQYSCLENPMDGGAWWAAVHGITKSQTRLSDFTFTFHFHALDKEMATHSSVLAWRIQGMGEPGGLLSMGLHRVGHDWSDLAAAAAAG